MVVNIYDYSKSSGINEENIKKLLEHAGNAERSTIYSLNVIIVNDAYIRHLNKRFLNRDQPTNVIAFPMEEVSEIYVSYEQTSNEGELYYYIIHGFLHLLGYEHGTEEAGRTMDNQCRRYIQEVMGDLDIGEKQ
jgi:probable rRNA maturation factor